MLAIVADTTPLNYLVLIETVDILPKLYGRVLIPPAVKTELSDPETPEMVRAWAAQSPPWLYVVAPRTPTPSPLLQLDAGEREAIALASEQQNCLLLMDERDGTTAARSLGLAVIGTLGLLDQAAIRGWIDLPTVFDRLRQTTFRSPHRLMAAMLEQHVQRKKKQDTP
jgi:predicted nucleic acid-binding protein